MSVRNLCLAILSRSDATGYEIRKESTEGRFSYFEDASFGSIYPALSRLEAEGMVTVREEPQDGKPTRKVYSITQAGRDAFLAALTEPHAPDTFKSPFLLVALYAAHVGPDIMRDALERQRKSIQARLDTLRQHPSCDEPGAHWTRAFGVACMTSTLNYLDAHGAELIKIAEAGEIAAALPAAAAE